LVISNRLAGPGAAAHEIDLVIDDSVHYTQQSESEDEYEESVNDSTDSSICIGYLLLYRLISYVGTGYAPYLFQTIFGYPYKIYNLHHTISYL